MVVVVLLVDHPLEPPKNAAELLRRVNPEENFCIFLHEALIERVPGGVAEAHAAEAAEAAGEAGVAPAAEANLFSLPPPPPPPSFTLERPAKSLSD